MIDVEKIVTPIPGESPSGESLRYSKVYDQIKTARREDDPNLPQGVWQSKLKKADWETVREVCLEALESKSKDLQIGAWLLEACILLDGFAGIAEGFRVLTALCERYWDTLYPPLDPDDPEFRFGPVVWIDEKLTLRIKLLPVTEPTVEEESLFAWSDWENALHQTRVSARDKSRKAAAESKERPLQTRFLSSAALTPTEFYERLKKQLSSALLEANRFEQVLVGFDRKQEGALHQLRDVLLAIEHFVGDILKDRGADIAETETEPASGMIPATETSEPDMAVKDQQDYSTSGPIRSRAQAYQMLAEAAEFLMKTEPHSPTPYLVKRAVAWGGMSLGELLSQVLRNPGELSELSRLLGLDEMPQKNKKSE